MPFYGNEFIQIWHLYSECEYSEFPKDEVHAMPADLQNVTHIGDDDYHTENEISLAE